MYYTVYVRSYPWKAVEYIRTTATYIIITSFATAVAVSSATWSAILRQFIKNYDLFQNTTPKMLGIMPAWQVSLLCFKLCWHI